MPTTTRKERIDIEALHQARAKVQAGLELGFMDKKVLLDLIQDGERKIFPTKMQRDKYQYQISQIESFEPCSDKFDYNKALDDIIQYERQFCEGK